MHLGKVFLTGGTGSFGRAFVQKIVELDNFTQLTIYSRDELKQFELANEITSDKLRFILGDVRDYNRLSDSLSDSDVLIHAAAMKQIPASENNPLEAIKTNVLGAENITRAAMANNVKNVIALSTDKAANPANLYGATKLCSDKLIISGNTAPENKGTKFSVVRYGNVLGSRGSVIPFFKEKSKTGILPITDFEMTRFWLTIDQGVMFVINSLARMHGGEIFVPKIPSFKVTDVAKVIAPTAKLELIGIRPGEKLHEVMITEDDSFYTIEFDDYYAILSPNLKLSKFYKNNGKKVEHGFRFSSDNNKDWHTLETFKSILTENNLL
jgi:UDP-N-acetylglucosamine 4,6-dehydratase